MQYYFKKILILISISIIILENNTTIVYAQQSCVPFSKIKEQVNSLKEKWIETDSIEKIVQQYNIVEKCFLTKDTYNTIMKWAKDSSAEVRFAGYIITKELVDTSGLKLFIFSNAAIDENYTIRSWVLFNNLTNDLLWEKADLKNKFLLNNLKILFNKFPTEIPFGTIRIIGKYQIIELKQELINLSNSNKNEKYDHNYFWSNRWVSLMALGRMNDKNAIKKMITNLNKSTDKFGFFETLAWVYTYVPNRDIRIFFIDIALSDKSLERMDPIDRNDKIGPTFLEYTIASVLRGNINNFPSGEVYAIKDEAKRIAFIRNWIKENKNTIILNKGN